MRGSAKFVLIVLMVVALVVFMATQEKSARVADTGDFKVVYEAGTSPVTSQFAQLFQQHKPFDQLVNALNQGLALPRDLTIASAECGKVNAFYDPGAKQVTMCYELVADFSQIFAKAAQPGTSEEELGRAVIDAMLYVLFHEMGHALIDIYDLGITGKEEDAVDQLSALILLEAGMEGSVINGANWFFLKGQQQTQISEAELADVHELDRQRFYNLICLIYGKDPQKNAYLVTQGILPEGRAAGCQQEYQKAYKAWENLLAPYEKK